MPSCLLYTSTYVWLDDAGALFASVSDWLSVLPDPWQSSLPALHTAQNKVVELSLIHIWTVGKQSIVLNQANGRIAYCFHARDLHLVMGPAVRGTSVRFRVLLDGQAPNAAHGVDVDDQGNGTVIEQRLYQLIRQKEPIADRQFEIEFLDSGAEAFDFTFG